MNTRNLNLEATRRLIDSYFIVNISLETTKLNFLCSVSKEDDGKVPSWLHSHVIVLQFSLLSRNVIDDVCDIVV